MLTTSILTVLGNVALATVLLYASHRLARHLHERTQRERLEQLMHPDESDRAQLARMHERHVAERRAGRVLWTE